MEIKKQYSFGLLKIKYVISDGFVTMVTNQPQVTKQIYEQVKREGKQVQFNQRVQAVTQFYPSLLAKEIEPLIEDEVKRARTHGLEAFKKVKQ